MRHRAPEDMTAEELDDLRYDAEMIRNPYKHCRCYHWNNFDGICAYCEWEEERNNNQEEANEEEE